jgi:hypothetical protein
LTFYCFRGTSKEGYTILGTPVRHECCISEHKQAVRHRVVESGFSELDQLVKLFIIFYQILWLITVILILYIVQIISFHLVMNTISWMPISILSLSCSHVLQLLCLLTGNLVKHIPSTQAHTYQFTFWTNMN